MGMGSGKEAIMSLTSVNGKSPKRMGMESTLGKMEIGMRESGGIV